MDFNKLQNIKKVIESMEIIHQKDILNIFIENDINITENNNGSFINLTSLESDIIKKIEIYIEYYNIQQSQLSFIEEEKKNIKNEFFSSDNKFKIHKVHEKSL